jgi:hypothetical protein
MQLPTRPLGRQLETLVEHFLVPGEKIVWWSQPSFLLRSTAALVSANLLIGAILLWSLLILQASGQIEQAASNGFWVGVGIFVMLVVASFLVFVLQSWATQRHTLYLVTTHRALAFEARTTKHFDIFQCFPEDLHSLVLRWNGIEWYESRDPNHLKRRAAFRGVWHARHVRLLVVATLRERLAERIAHGGPAVRSHALASVAAMASPEWCPEDLLRLAQVDPSRFGGPTSAAFVADATDEGISWIEPQPSEQPLSK